VPILGNFSGTDIILGLFVKHQSRMPESLVKTFTNITDERAGRYIG
jgi:hypothetical protein